MINHYKSENDEFLCYGKEMKFPDSYELVKENVDPSTPEYRTYNIMSYADYLMRVILHKRTDDIRLSEEGINTFHDLSMAYVLHKMMKLNKSKSIRDLVLKKYTEILDELNEPNETTMISE